LVVVLGLAAFTAAIGDPVTGRLDLVVVPSGSGARRSRIIPIGESRALSGEVCAVRRPESASRQ